MTVEDVLNVDIDITVNLIHFGTLTVNSAMMNLAFITDAVVPKGTDSHKNG